MTPLTPAQADFLRDIRDGIDPAKRGNVKEILAELMPWAAEHGFVITGHRARPARGDEPARPEAPMRLTPAGRRIARRL